MFKNLIFEMVLVSEKLERLLDSIKEFAQKYEINIEYLELYFDAKFVENVRNLELKYPLIQEYMINTGKYKSLHIILILMVFTHVHMYVCF